MGDIHELECKACGAVERYSTGVGQYSIFSSLKLLEGDLETLKRSVSDELYQLVTQIISGEKGRIRFSFDDGNYFCSDCGTASHLKRLKIAGLKAGEWRQPVNCTSCDKEMEPTNTKLDFFKCKKCGDAVLEYRWAGIWD